MSEIKLVVIRILPQSHKVCLDSSLVFYFQNKFNVRLVRFYQILRRSNSFLGFVLIEIF